MTHKTFRFAAIAIALLAAPAAWAQAGGGQGGGGGGGSGGGGGQDPASVYAPGNNSGKKQNLYNYPYEQKPETGVQQRCEGRRVRAVDAGGRPYWACGAIRR